MATDSGTATDYLDLLTKFRDFITANTDLVTASQEWTQIGGPSVGALTASDFISLQGPGLAGTDEIFISLRTYTDAGNGYYHLEMCGHTAYNLAVPGFDQIGTDSNSVYILGVNTAIAYWFFANGRHFKIVTRINGRYDSLYGGFILPEHAPADWSYPVFIGGSSYTPILQASSDSPIHSNWWDANANTYANGALSAAYLFSPIQAWVPIRNTWNPSEIDTGESGRVTVPWSSAMNENVKRCLDNSPWLVRGQIVAFGSTLAASPTPIPEVPEGGTFYGSFDGAFFTPGFGSVAEQVITDPADSKDYIVFPNVYRSSDVEVIAFAVE